MAVPNSFGLRLWQLMNYISLLSIRGEGPADGLDSISTEIDIRKSWIFEIPKDHYQIPVIEFGEGYYHLIKDRCARKAETRIHISFVVRRLQF